MKRRSLIESTATLGLGALAGCALPGTAATFCSSSSRLQKSRSFRPNEEMFGKR